MVNRLAYQKNRRGDLPLDVHCERLLSALGSSRDVNRAAVQQICLRAPNNGSEVPAETQLPQFTTYNSAIFGITSVLNRCSERRASASDIEPRKR